MIYVLRDIHGNERQFNSILKQINLQNEYTLYIVDDAPMKLWYGNRCIGIDCGSGYPEVCSNSEYGRLACLQLDDGVVFYSEEECKAH